MSVDLKRVRDAHDDGNLSPSSKKRLLAASSSSSFSTTGPPGAAGASRAMSNSDSDSDDNGIEDWMRVVETRRKEAIYRQMLEYKRASRDAAAKVRELEVQKKRLEASEHAVEACWTQLVSVIQDLVGQQAGSSQAALEPSLDSDESSPILHEAIKQRSTATRELVTRFIEVAKQSSPTSTGELEKRCASLHSETSSLRAVNKTLKTEISTLKSARDQAQSSLGRSQKQLDKARMEHDKALLSLKSQSSSLVAGDRDTAKDGASTPGGLKAGAYTNGPTSGHATPNGTGNGLKSEPGASSDIKPLLNDASALLSDSASLERLAETRLRELEKVSEENTALNRELDRLRQLALNPSEEALRSAPFFGIYLRQLASQASELSSVRSRYTSAESKLDELRNQNLAFRDAVVADGRAEAEALRLQVNKQNSDLARLRGQRDDMQAELAERRLKEESALGSGKELEGLVKGQTDRIETLLSEVRRLKGKLGAEGSKGRQGYLTWLKEGVEGDYVVGLEDKVRDLEIRLHATASHPDAAANGQTGVQLEAAKRDLEMYQRVLGSTAEAGDLSAMAARLQVADEGRRELEMKLEQSAASTNSLYSEVEALASLSDSLQSQLASKVFDMRDAEGRLSRLATEKAKADNKYFQAMRTKEAIEAECRTAQRSVEKQARLLEKALEVERGLQAQVAAQEKQITAMKNEMQDLQGKWVREQEGRREAEGRGMAAQASLVEANSIMQQRVAEAAAERKLRIKHEEEADKATAQVKRLKEKQESLVAQSATQNLSTSEVALADERDKLMKLLRCSCCEQNFKAQMIVKCGHTFCKPCLDVRISTRQRKCPACGLGFFKGGGSDHLLAVDGRYDPVGALHPKACRLHVYSATILRLQPRSLSRSSQHIQADHPDRLNNFVGFQREQPYLCAR